MQRQNTKTNKVTTYKHTHKINYNQNKNCLSLRMFKECPRS